MVFAGIEIMSLALLTTAHAAQTNSCHEETEIGTPITTSEGSHGSSDALASKELQIAMLTGQRSSFH